jgi:uncharacterized protein (TIGR03437 family)
MRERRGPPIAIMAHLMRFPCLVVLAAANLVFLANAQVPPAVDPGSVVNAASRMPSSLPGGALARGARFSLSGVRLGPERGVKGSESDPPATLDGVSVHIAQGQKDVSAGILFASAGRIEGLIPPAAPLGPVRLTVIYNGLASEPYPVTLVDTSFGFFTVDTAPEELPKARLPLSATPGEAIALWGAGLGDTRPEVFLAGKPVTVHSAADEACCKGVDRIEIQIPVNASLGCAVPIQARAGGRPSNVIAISIHPAGRSCSDQFEWFATTVQHAARAGFVALARISLDLNTAAKVGSYQFDYALASFGNQQAGQRTFSSLPPFGACTVTSLRINLHQLLSAARSPSAWTAIPVPAAGNRGLDAGPAISVSGPAGVKVVSRQGRQRDAYSALLGGAVPFTQVPRTPLYLAPGAVYKVSSSGGKDVGPFETRVEAQRVITLKNRARLAKILRSAGVTLEWTEARPDDAVLIAAASSDTVTGDSSLCVCMAYAKDRRFTIPPISLGNLPATREGDLEPSLLLLAELPLRQPVSLQAQGLDAAFATFVSINARLVRFQ